MTLQQAERLKIPCETCGKIVLRSRSRLWPHTYCSKACLSKQRRIETTCFTCGKPVVRTVCKLKTAKHGHFFCSKSCVVKDTARQKRERFGADLPDHLRAYLKEVNSYDSQSNRLLRVKAMLVISPEIRCVSCGCDVVGIIEINHKNGGGRAEFLKGNDKFYRAIATGVRTIDDLELRCKVCNILHYVEMKGIKGFKVTYSVPIIAPP